MKSSDNMLGIFSQQHRKFPTLAMAYVTVALYLLSHFSITHAYADVFTRYDDQLQNVFDPEDDAEEDTEEDVEEEIEEDTEEDVEDEIEEDTEEDVEEEIEEDTEEDVEEEIEEDTEEDVEEEIEEDTEEDVEEDTDEEFEEGTEEDVEDEYEEEFEEEHDNDFEHDYEESEDEFDNEIEDDHSEDDIDHGFEDEHDNSEDAHDGDDDSEEEFNNWMGRDEDDNYRTMSDNNASDATQFELTNGDRDDDYIDFNGDRETEFTEEAEALFEDLEGNQIWTNEWVIMADRDTKEELEKEGYQFVDEEELEALDVVIASVIAPASFDLQQDYQTVMARLNKEGSVADFNHIYQYAKSTPRPKTGTMPGELLSLDGSGLTLGMIDTSADLTHSVLASSNITQRSFVAKNREESTGHGTAVASILVGSNDDFAGVLKGSTLLNASVFFNVRGKGDIADTLAIVKGLNWLLSNDIGVVNMSLAGPPNRLLQSAIRKLCQSGVSIVAAAGNEGPLSKPLYPAAYDCTVAVTAVDTNLNLYRKAVLGEHIDLAAYGVDIIAANKNHDLTSQSGTSIATPFVSALLTAYKASMTAAQFKQWQKNCDNCLDLGATGQDKQFGKGLLPTASANDQFLK